jgi:hypothetical protein
MSPNGWTDDFIGAEWFEKSFIPQATARNKSGKPILLILDGHSSHETSHILHLAELHNIIILCLPPHTTHKLQPLDVGVFGPLQRAWLERCDSVVELTGAEMPKEDFVNEYMDVREASFRSSTIISAFKKSGVWPVDRAVFLDDDFAPSIPYSTEAQDIPSLPDKSESDSDSDSESDSDDSDTDGPHGDGIIFYRTRQTQQSMSAPQPVSPIPDHDLPQSSIMSPTPEQAPSSTPQPTPEQAQSSQSTAVSPADAPGPSPVHPSHSLSGPIPPAQFYHDPVLFGRILQLEKEVQDMSRW